jgi:hypothetical protein
MSEKRTININPDLFKVSSNTSRKKRKDDNPNKEIKVRGPKVQNNKTLRGKLLRYIRDQQERNYQKKMESTSSNGPATNKPIPNPMDDFNSDFDSSLQYLMKITDENSKNPKKSHNSTIKHYPNNEPNSLFFNNNSFQPFENISNTLPEIFDVPNIVNTKPVMQINRPNQPNYGCLKGGRLPTYRTWKNQTQRNYPPSINTMPISSNVPAIPNTNRIIPKVYPMIAGESKTTPSMNDLEKEREKAKERVEMKKMIQRQKPIAQPKLKYLKQKRTLKRTYHVGKSKVEPKVAVLVSNKTIRNNVTTKAQLLKQTPIEEIRKFLIKKGLIKVGSTSPNDVLRKMYESVVMISGDVVNHNPDNLLYNFFNDK